MELMRVQHPTELPTLSAAMNQFQREMIQLALDVCAGNRSRAAAALGIHRNSLTRLCAERGIHKAYGKPSGDKR